MTAQILTFEPGLEQLFFFLFFFSTELQMKLKMKTEAALNVLELTDLSYVFGALNVFHKANGIKKCNLWFSCSGLFIRISVSLE